MPGHNYKHPTCELCGESVNLETGIELTTERGNEPTRVALCEECATVECGHCGTDVSIHSALKGSDRRRAGCTLVECSRCGDEVPVAHAAEIRHTRIKQYRRRVCGDCLDQIAVTADYRVVREFSPI